MTSIALALTLTSACNLDEGPGPTPDPGSNPGPNPGPGPGPGPGPAPVPGEEGERAPGSGDGSDCGGYERDGGFFTPADTGDDTPDAYCDASMLYWTYDAAAATLRVRHTRTEMNCGAEPAVDLWIEDGVLQIVEKEIIDEEPYGCQCVFDFNVVLEDVPPDLVPLEIWQREHYEDQGKGTRIWNGTLDVSPGTGEIVISDEETSWCDQESP